MFNPLAGLAMYNNYDYGQYGKKRPCDAINTAPLGNEYGASPHQHDCAHSTLDAQSRREKMQMQWRSSNKDNS